MAGLLVIEAFGLVLAASAAPVAIRPTVATIEAGRAVHGFSEAAPAMPVRARTRDERIGSLALRGFPSGDRWESPAKAWGNQASDPVVESVRWAESVFAAPIWRTSHSTGYFDSTA